MASVFKRPSSPGKTRSRFWQMKYLDRHGRRRRKSSGLTDKAEALRRANILEARERDIRVGVTSPIMESVEDAARTPIESHVEDFIAADKANGLSERRIRGKQLHLRRFVDQAGIRRIGQIDARAITAHMRYAVEIGFPVSSDGRYREGGSESGDGDHRRVSPATANEIRTTILSFLSWLVSEQRLAAHPCPDRSVRKLKSAHDRRKKRRALLPDEVERLLASVAGESREDVYRLAMLTGLRRGELAQLQWRDVILDDAEPRLRLRAEATKAKREDEVPLHGDAIRVLKRLRKGAAHPTEAVFREIPGPQQLYRDLAAAGIQQVEGRRPVPNASGETVDFHSLRRTFGTSLVKAGVPPLQLKRLMRHRDIRTTDTYYTDLRLSDQAAELEKITLGATGGVVRPKVRPHGTREGTTGCEIVPVDLPQTTIASRSQPVSHAGVGEGVRGDATKRVMRFELTTFTLAT